MKKSSQKIKPKRNKTRNIKETLSDSTLILLNTREGFIYYLFILSRLTSFSRCGYVDTFKHMK
jgi:hypothetical protein